MKRLAWMWVLAILMVLAVPVAWSQEKEKEKEKGPEPAKAVEKEPAEKPKSKESKVAGTPYIYSGPDTGFGAGFALAAAGALTGFVRPTQDEETLFQLLG